MNQNKTPNQNQPTNALHPSIFSTYFKELVQVPEKNKLKIIFK